MGMWPHIESVAGHEPARSHLIKEDERADHLPFVGWQGPTHLEPSNVVGAGYVDSLDALWPSRNRCRPFALHGSLS
jgi:hypothetical protein